VPIRISCPNGHILEAADQSAGKKVRCPRCREIMDVPAPRTAVSAGNLPSSSQPTAEPSTTDDLEVVSSEKDDDEVVSTEAVAESRTSRLRSADEDDDVEADRGRDQVRRRLSKHKDEDENLERKRLRKEIKRERREAEQLGAVRLGLGLHLLKVGAYVLTMFLVLANFFVQRMIVISARMAAAESKNEKDVARIVESATDASAGAVVLFLVMVAFMFLLAPVLGVVGSLLCCRVPPKFKSRHLIVASLLCDLVPFAVGLVGAVIWAVARRNPLAGGSAMGVIVQLLIVACGLAAVVLFMLFLKSLARYLDDYNTADEARRVMIQFVIFVVSGVIATSLLASLILKTVPPSNQPIALASLGMLWLFLLAYLMARQGGVIQSCRALID
jgi:hypothetical protein